MLMIYANFDLRQGKKFPSVEGLQEWLEDDAHADGATIFFPADETMDYVTVSFCETYENWEIDFGIADCDGNHLDCQGETLHFDDKGDALNFFVKEVLSGEVSGA